MEIRKKTSLVLILFFASLFFLPSASFAEPVEIWSFEPGDTLEEIRAKIEHNGYEFTVDNNWVFDMSSEEKREFFSRSAPLFPQISDGYDIISHLTKHLGERQLPLSFDWRNYNGHSYIGPIRDQGNCGACYAFGACAAAEGAYNWANGKYDGNCADFSEAFVAFCLSDYYSGFGGCDGSDYDYQELTALVEYGVCNDDVYPYTDYEQVCQASSWGAPRTIFQSWHRAGCNDIDAIKTAIMTYGVIDAAVYAGNAFSAYSGGIYQDSNTSCYSVPCYYTPTNHIIALVGWDDNGGDGYWILRNSWGTAWGESGYMRIKYTSARVSCETAYLVYQSVVGTIYVEPSGSCGGYTPCYSTIQVAIDAADPETIIKIAQGTFNEDLTISRSVDLVLQGGWDSSWAAQSSSTTVTSMTISNGSVTVDKLVVQ